MPISIQDLIGEEADRAGVPRALAFAVAQQESGDDFNPTAINPTAVNGEHAVGTFQLLPSTARTLGVDPHDPRQNVQGGIKYLRQLLDAHQGDIDGVLADYGGVKRDTSYVPAVRQRMERWRTQLATQPSGVTPPAQPPVDETPAPGTFAANHPFLNSVIQGFDPHELEGRHNIAGGVGAAVGGGLGALTAPVTGPWGARVGSVAGAALGGGAEQLLLEETGLGQKLANYLPGQQDVATPPPKPDESAWDRALAAGEQQGLYDVGGQLIGGAVRYAAKPLLESSVGRAAATYFTKQKQDAILALQGTLDRMRNARDAALAALDVTGRDLRTTASEQAAGTKQWFGLGRRATASQSRVAIEQARADAEAATQAIRDEYQKNLLAAAPSQVAAGRGVADIFQGPGKAARDIAGQAVDEAARNGPDISIADLKAEAQRIARDELRPPERTFPREAPPPETQPALGTAPPAPPDPQAQWPVSGGSFTKLFDEVLADARARGYTGSAADLRQALQGHVADAQSYIDEHLAAEGEHGARALLEKIRDYGGIGPDDAYSGEISRLWESSSAYTPGKGWAAGANRLARGRMAGETGGFNGVTGVLKREAEGPYVARTGGHSLDRMAELLRQDPQFSHITGPNELLDALEQAIRPGATESTAPSVAQVLEQSGIRPGSDWWRTSAPDLLAQGEDARLQELVKHPAMGVINRILNAPDTVDFYTAHLWKSQLQQALAGTYDRVQKSQMTNITQHLTRGLREALAVHEPYNQATRAYQSVADLFTKGHAPIIKRMARAEPEKIAQTIRTNAPSAARMLVNVLTEQAEIGGGAEGRKAGEEALRNVQDAWLHRQVLSGPIDQLADRVATLKQKSPEFVDAFLNTPHAQAQLQNAETLGAAFKQLVEDNTQKIAAAREAGRKAVEGATTAGERVLADTKAQGARRVEAHAQQRAAAAAQTAADIRAQGAAIRTRRLGTPEEQAFAKSTMTEQYRNAGRSMASRQLEYVMRGALLAVGGYQFGMPGLMLAGLVRSGRKASEADLLRYAAQSRPLTEFLVKQLYSPANKLRWNALVGAGVRGLGGGVGDSEVATPPPDQPTLNLTISSKEQP